MAFISGKITQFTLLIAMFIVMEWASRTKTALPLRRLPALDVVDEYIGRSVEMGRPVLTSTGRFGFQSMWAATAGIGVDMLGYTSKQCLEKDADLIIGIMPADVLPVAREVYRDACLITGHPEKFNPTYNIRFFGGGAGDPRYSGYIPGFMGIIEREEPGSMLLFGMYWQETVQMGISARRHDCISVATGVEFDMASFGLISCDYMLLAEESYAAGAYVSGDPSKSNTLLMEDVIKWLFIGLLLVGVIISPTAILNLLQF